MSRRTAVADRLKADLLSELRLITPEDLSDYRQKGPLGKSDLTAIAKNNKTLGKCLSFLPTRIRAAASAQPDPFGWLLAIVPLKEWGRFCDERSAPWMTRVWLAAASQFRAEWRLIQKAHGWRDTFNKLRENPQSDKAADAFFFARLCASKGKEKRHWLEIPGLAQRLAKAREEKDEAFLRRFKRAQIKEPGVPLISVVEFYMVRHWLALPRGFPGLCFFSDKAIHDFLVARGITRNPPADLEEVRAIEHATTKQVRERLGLIQAGAKQHLVSRVSCSLGVLRLKSRYLRHDWTFRGSAKWRGRRKDPFP